MSSSSAIAPPSIAASVTVKLSATNFVMWQAQILTHLRGHCLLGHIDGSLDSPSETIFTNTDVGRSEVVNPDYTTWYVRDQVVLGGFFSTVTEEVLAHIMNAPTARCLGDPGAHVCLQVTRTGHPDPFAADCGEAPGGHACCDRAATS
jgi:hypothetical protein